MWWMWMSADVDMGDMCVCNMEKPEKTASRGSSCRFC